MNWRAEIQEATVGATEVKVKREWPSSLRTYDLCRHVAKPGGADSILAAEMRDSQQATAKSTAAGREEVFPHFHSVATPYKNES